jgi:peptidoglycan hydrolase-like protein with peptidoglycan-binding domain
MGRRRKTAVLMSRSASPTRVASPSDPPDFLDPEPEPKMSSLFRNLAAASMITIGMLAFAPAAGQSLGGIARTAATVDRTDREAVRSLQMGLRDLGFYSGPIDGIFGTRTYRAAVAAVAAAGSTPDAVPADTAPSPDAGEGPLASPEGATASAATSASSGASASSGGGGAGIVASDPGTSVTASAVDFDRGDASQ